MFVSVLNPRKRFRACWLVALVPLLAQISQAQLQITEVLSDSLSSEPKWEWVEVRNMGTSPLDLNDYVFDDDDGQILTAPNISNLNGPTTIPAGGVAVLYNGSSFSYNPQLFRDAWQIGNQVPMIGISTATGLNNSGDHFGIWPSYASYLNDSVDDGMGGFVVGSFNSATADVDYATFPSGPAGVSSYWNGSGDYRDGTNWAASVDGVGGAVTSIEISTFSSINSVDDVGNPGVIPAGPQAAGLLISEIMYNPRSAEPGWEWIEVVNNTGSAINFGANNYFVDDAAGAALGAANLTAGSIPQGGVAVLYDASRTPAEFNSAWGPGLNAIAVSNWPALNNDGDTIGIWGNAADYNTDRTNMNFDNATATVLYDDDGAIWPLDDGDGSIYLTNLAADKTDGTNWLLSFPGDGLSFMAAAVGGTVIQHNGGDVGSPGSVPSGGSMIDADFNNDGMINGADIDLLTMDIANMTNDVGMFDLTGDGSVTLDDVNQWLADAGAANLPSMNPYLIGDANLDGTVDGQDFIQWNSAKFTGTGKWTMADFNADGQTDGQDFIDWNTNKFMSSDSLSAVPEPAMDVVMLLLVCGGASRGRRLWPPAGKQTYHCL